MSGPDGAVLPMFTVYAGPADYPGVPFVIREWFTSGAGSVPGRAWGARTLDAARALVPEGFYRLPRADTDHPTVVETWI